ncbi:hypothetical protein NQ838_17905, partial [Acinetobacter baumannii]|nr:hypothetical protein [Acinetobacter baumannii]
MQDKQNNESLQFQENLIFPRIKAQLIRDYNFLKNNLSLLIILPSVLGGLWQIIELFSIDLPYIRFFSINQMVPDGVLILFLLFYIFSICSLIRYIPQ